MSLKNREFYMKSLISCFFIVFFCFYSALASEENRERAFYAISSLKYHLEQKLSNKESEDQIAFEEDDIAVLWEKAYSDSEIDPLINSAYTNYYQALERNNLQLFNQSRVHLHHAWQTISDSKFRSLIQTTDSISKAAFKSYPNFDDNPYLDESMRQRIRPHLLPIDHPAKIFLDEIFKNINAIKNYEIFTGLGFKKIAQNGARLGSLHVLHAESMIGARILVNFVTETERAHLEVPSTKKDS